MRLNEFVSEAALTHPLPKGVNRWAEDQYAAFVVVMHPRDFLELTTSSVQEFDEIMASVDVKLDDFRNGTDATFHKNKYSLPPFLDICWPSGQVYRHEGRHRAARVLKAGGKKFTCYVSCFADRVWEVKWEIVNLDEIWDDPEIKSQVCDSKEAAKQLENELYSSNRVDGVRFLNKNIKVNSTIPRLMKGGPNTQYWDYEPWEKSNMPANFIGQYRDWVKVPTTRMKFAPMKSRINKKKA